MEDLILEKAGVLGQKGCRKLVLGLEVVSALIRVQDVKVGVNPYFYR